MDKESKFWIDPKFRPPERHKDSPDTPEPYLASPQLIKAVNLAIYLRRPLLLEGEAGCGKTRLARAVAHQLELPFYRWDVRSTTKACHRFTRDLVDTVQNESTIKSENVNVFYFHNIIASSVYEDFRLTTPVSLNKVLADCDNNTSVLIVSDAGAARGHRHKERVFSTTETLFRIRQHTNLIAWLNPIPKERWEGTSAQIISLSVTMFQLDTEGLNNAIDVVRGQTLQPQR